MTEAIRKLFTIMPFLFGIGFIAPLTAQLMAYWGIPGPFGHEPDRVRAAVRRSLGALRQHQGTLVVTGAMTGAATGLDGGGIMTDGPH